MGQVLHGSATTAHAVRAAIQRSQASASELAGQYGLNEKTVRKWRKRSTVENVRMPRVMVTDNLGSYAAAKAKLVPSIEHRRPKGINNAAEASHRHTRIREKVMGRFKSPRQAQRFLSVHDQAVAIFRLRRHRLSARSYHHARIDAFEISADYTAEFSA